MIRRNFIKLATLASASTLAAAGATATSAKKTVDFKVEGFTCITCAAGLDALLERQEGVVSSRSSYKDATATVCFHPALTSEGTLQDAIAELGFTALIQS